MRPEAASTTSARSSSAAESQLVSYGAPHLGSLSAFVSIRQHTSAYVSIYQHTSAYVSIREHISAYISIRLYTDSLRLIYSAYIVSKIVVAKEMRP
jgi:hypothetical protein